LFTGSLRNDGSSNFATGNQWGLFPSAAFAWRASEEKFFSPLKSYFDNLKFRLSYGKVGNSNVGAFAYESMLENVQSNWGVSLKTSNIANRDLSWESTTSWNAGVDLNLFKNRIELVFDTYIRKTDNLLLQAQLPGYLGTTGSGSASAPWLNIGSIENKGFEFSINTKNFAKQNFKWTSALTFSTVRNKVTKMNTELAIIDKSYQATGTYTDVITRTAVGQPISQFYGYVALGRINTASDFLTDNGDGTSTVTIATRTYQKNQVISNTAYNQNSTFIGDLIFKDCNEDGIIDSKDKTYIGNPLPVFTSGFTNNFTYKNFDLSVFVYASYGNKIFNMYRVKIDDPNVVSNVSTRVLDYARIGFVDGDVTNKNIWNHYVLPGADPSQVRMEIGHTNLNHAISSRFVEDGSFVRIQNVSFGYTFPGRISKMIKINKLRVYSNIQNLFTFSKYTGYDPEVGSTQGQYSTSGQGMLMYGVDASRMPSPRTYTIGLDITL
jgi:TonB-linked SusC/RagA family outer membrane protein